MKINGMAVQTPQKQQIAESVNAAGKGAVSDTGEQQESGAVVLNVSQRNAVSLGGESAEMDKGSVSSFLKSLLENPDSTSQLHAGLSPERVLQLLA